MIRQFDGSDLSGAGSQVKTADLLLGNAQFPACLLFGQFCSDLYWGEDWQDLVR